MGQLVAQQERQLLEKILSLYKHIQVNKDEETAEKVKELGRKTVESEFAIAFCGHFSAGKSSMINSLIGENILPSSPIPTSANLVRIKSGEEYAKVFFKHGGSRLYPAPYHYETVKSYCKDGDQIDAIEISHQGAAFLEDAIIMDTPGIDSTDDAHRIATESALHLSDIVFYVMDYNHVQSELNFLFTKELTDAGKELYLIINQIDKHQDAELSFDQFRESAESSFAEWGVKHAGIFYTTLRDGNSAFNQFEELRHFIEDRKNKRMEILPGSIFRSLEKLSEDHLSLLGQEAEERLQESETILEGISESELQLLPVKLKEIGTEINRLEKEQNPEREFTDGINEILKNAYLMPFQTRELAEAYIVARQPDFKVGLFFSKQKTEQERVARLDRFYDDLVDKVQSQLDWHIKDFLIKLFRTNDLANQELQGMAQAFRLDFEKELLSDLVKPGARVSGDYVLNYTNEVAETIKSLARRRLQPIKDQFIDIMTVQVDEEFVALTKEEKKCEHLLSAWENVSQIKQALTLQRREISEILYGHEEKAFHEDEYAIFKTEASKPEIISEDEFSIQEKKMAEPVESEQNTDVQEDEGGFARSHERHLQLVDKLEFTSSKIESLPGLKKISRELKDKAARLKQKEFTVALFGAFSAGKSSFANALVGERLLPVSPNPTTAAINKIKPVTDEHPHGSVIVKVKNRSEMQKEVERSLGLFGLSTSGIEDALSQINELKWEDSGYSAVEKTHYAFLKAFAKGFNEFKNQFGEFLHVDLGSFKGYVAEEEKSCFVEWIEVYYDCPLTKEGITLVDTPGADSINARHTGVAFDYIRNSDAILFVTYYNHAFSKADREFLIQLGRVKDTFELDKMFFVVNAVDLANSSEELADVLEYVEDQLIQYGIRKPHLFPVSSLKALHTKLEQELKEDHLFKQFEQSFYSFIANDLMNMALEAAEQKWLQAVTLIERMIQSAEQDQADRAKKRVKLESEKEQMLELLTNKQASLLENRLVQEADELTYYIRQRVFIRFGEFFRESFNPSLLKDDGRNLKKALESALDELIESIGFDLTQEMRATSLRIEAFISRILMDFQKSLISELSKINPSISISLAESTSPAGLEFDTAFQTIDRTSLKKALSLFRNPKSFFEKNEKKQMSEELEKQLETPAGDYLESENIRLKEHYLQQLNLAFSKIQEDLTEQINEYFEGISSALGNEFSTEHVKNTLVIVKSYDKGLKE